MPVICLIVLPCCVFGITGFEEYERLNGWIGSGWSEYEDQSSALWGLEAWTVNINRSDFHQLTAFQVIDDSSALIIVEERERQGSFSDGTNLLERTEISKSLLSRIEGLATIGRQPFAARYHVRTDRRYGFGVDEDTERYNGSPYGLTQRFSLTTGSLTAGGMLDKDKYEPSMTDMSRFYMAYRSDRLSVIGGDFHLSSGYGVTLNTRPTFGSGFDAKAAYIKGFDGIRPAVEAQENSAFRGLSVEMNSERLQFNLFSAYTDLDAIVDNDGKILRLSDSGLHRTDGEDQKNNSINEEAFGGGIRYTRVIEDTQCNLFLSGYVSRFDEPFSPELTPRDRFQLTGDKSGAVGMGSEVSGADYSLGGEVGVDYDRDFAWKVVLTQRNIAGKRWAFYSTLYHYPPAYINHRAGSLASGKPAENRTGAAMLTGGHCDLGLLKRYKVHLEVERRPWRSYTVPTPLSSARESIELGFHLSRRDELTVRYRRRSGTEGHGEEAATTKFDENRLRLTLVKKPEKQYITYRIKFWSEFVSRWDDDTGSNYGSVGGFRITDGLGWLAQVLTPLRYYLSASHFSSPDGLPFYIGETDLPDRLASVRVSGHGVRLAGALVWRRGRMNWLAAQVARTIRTDDYGRSSDIEAYVSLSFHFDKEYSNRTTE